MNWSRPLPICRAGPARGCRSQLFLRSRRVGGASLDTYLGGNRVRSQVLDQYSRDARLVSGFHIDMHSANPSLLALSSGARTRACLAWSRPSRARSFLPR